VRREELHDSLTRHRKGRICALFLVKSNGRSAVTG
jgi:hypothetical protein